MEILVKAYLSLGAINPLYFWATNLRKADEHSHIINSGLLHICLVNYTHGRNLCTHVFTYAPKESGRQGGRYTTNLCLRFAYVLHCNSSAIQAEALDEVASRVPLPPLVCWLTWD